MRTKPSREELLSSQDVLDKIAERAYFFALAEGFPEGREVQHWLAAEIEVLREMDKKSATPTKAVVNGVGNGKKPPPKAAAKRV